MFLFLMILMPLLCSFCFLQTKSKTSLFVSFIGAFTGILVCILSAIFSFKHRIPEFSFASNFLYYSLYEYAIPMIVLYLAYFFIARVPVEFKVKTFLPLEAGFFAIYMPYSIITTRNSAFSAFELFVKPALFVSMLLLCAIFILQIGKSATENKLAKIILNSVFIAISIFVPTFINTIWLLGLFIPTVYITSAIFIILAFLPYFKSFTMN